MKYFLRMLPIVFGVGAMASIALAIYLSPIEDYQKMIFSAFVCALSFSFSVVG